jgi:hypothetical protein
MNSLDVSKILNAVDDGGASFLGENCSWQHRTGSDVNLGIIETLSVFKALQIFPGALIVVEQRQGSAEFLCSGPAVALLLQ